MTQGIHFYSDDGVAEAAFFDDAVKGIIPIKLPYWLVSLIAVILTAIPWA